MSSTHPPLDVDFNEIPVLGNSWLDRLDRIREAEPVFWSAHQGAWLITRHEDILVAFQRRVPVTSAQRLEGLLFGAYPSEKWPELFPTSAHYMSRWIINVDGADHSRLRRLVVKAFNKGVVEAVRSYAQVTIDGVLDRVADRQAVEFVKEVALIIPSLTLLRLMGVPEDVLPKLMQWSIDLVTSTSSPHPSLEILQSGDRVLRELAELFKDLIAERRAHPRKDLLSEMITAVDEGDRLSEDEMIGLCQVLLIAGQDTTGNSMTLNVEALARNPGQRRWLSENPGSVDQATLELSRYVAMSGGQTRVATDDFDWHGKRIRKGDVIFAMIAAGNRDPRMFENPTALDFTRKNLDRILTFAPGLHHCVGHLLARMQLNEFNQRAYSRFREIRVLDDELRFNPGFSFRSPKSLNVQFVS